MCRLFPIIVFLCMAAAAVAEESTVPADIGPKTSILVLSFESRGASAEKVAMADDYLMEALAQLKRFTMVEREKLDKVLLEQKLSREKLTMPEQSIALGRLLSADQILSARMEEIRGKTVVTIRMVATATSATRDYSVTAEVGGMREFRKLIAQMAAKVAKDFPLLEGKIIKVAGNSYKGDFARSGLRNGLDVIVYRWGEVVSHPETGRQLGRKVIRVASGVITSVEGKTASIQLSRIEKSRPVKEGDLIISR